MDYKITKNPVGYLNAESLAERENLQENFIKTTDYYKILDPTCLFISGRKGDGKTALSLMILDEVDEKGEYLYKYSKIIRKPDFYRPLIFDTREYSLIRATDYTSTLKERLDFEKYFEKLWEYIIYISAMKAVIEKNTDENLKEITDFLKNKNFLVNVENFIDIFFDIINQDIRDAKEDKDYFIATNLYQKILLKLNDKSFLIALKALRSHLNEDNKVIIIIDTVEQYYAKEEMFRKAVQGMMQEVYEIKLNEKNKWIDIKLFIPDELYEDFAGWNLNKAFDSTVFLSWRYKELLHFICRRYMTYIEKNYDSRTVAIYKEKWDKIDKNDKNSLRSFWNEFFPKQIKDRFGAYEDCFNYILRHSQNKPRQIIHLSNEIINKAEKKGHSPDKINEKDVYWGIHTNLNQLVVDNLKPFSESDELIDCINNMFFNESNIFDGRIVGDCIKKDMPKYRTMGLNSIKVKKILLRSGFLGKVSKIITRKISNGSEIKIYYTNFDYLMHGHLSSINNDDKCALHSILADHLGSSIRRSYDSCVYPYAGQDYEGEEDELVNTTDYLDD